MADENLDKLRKDYEEVFGKKAFNGWNAQELQAKIDAKLAGNDDGTEADPPASASDPYPSQADLDAIRLGQFGSAPKNKREAKAGESAGYKTR